MPRSPHLAALVTAAGLAIASCGSDGSSSDDTTAVTEPATTVDAEPSTSPAPATSEATTTTAAPTTTVEPPTTTTTPPAPTTTAAPATTTTAPPTDGPDAALALIDLDAATLAGWPDFANGDTDLVATVTATLGEPTDDSGWLPMPPKLACTGANDYRSYHWGDLRVVVERRTVDAAPTVNGWSLGDAQPFFTPARLDGVALTPPSAVTTTDGVGLGDPVAEITSENLVETEPGRFVAPGARVVIVETDDAGAITGFESSRNDCIGLDISDVPCGRPIPVFALPGGVPTGEPTIDGDQVTWSPAPDVDPAVAGSTVNVTEVLGGAANADPQILLLATTAPINAQSGAVDVRLVPIGDPGVGQAQIFVFDARTPCVRQLFLDVGPELEEWRAYVADLASQLAPQL